MNQIMRPVMTFLPLYVLALSFVIVGSLYQSLHTAVLVPSVPVSIRERAFSSNPFPELIERREYREQKAVSFVPERDFLEEFFRQQGKGKRALHFARLISDNCIHYQIDPLLVTAMMERESNFKARARSSKGARGLLQVMPQTGLHSAKLAGVQWLGAEALYEPAYNIKLGVTYFEYLLDLFDGDIQQALMAYNWGPNNVLRMKERRRQAPRMVRLYAASVVQRYRDLQRQLLGPYNPKPLNLQ